MNALSYIFAQKPYKKSSTGFLNTAAKPGGAGYPFGMQMPGRMYNVDHYNYGFNGMAKDDEIKGSGNSYDFGNRIQDPRLGRFMSVDRYSKKFPHQSPYLFAGNTPIRGIDGNGDSLYLGGNITTVMLDLYSIIKSDEKKASLTLNSSGKVETSLTNKAIMEMGISDPIDMQVIEILNSPTKNLYEVTNNESSSIKGGSNTAPQIATEEGDPVITVPSKNGFDNFRTMPNRDFVEYEEDESGKRVVKSRESSISHEIIEMNLMSRGVPYEFRDPNNKGKKHPTKKGAHRKSIDIQKSVGGKRSGANPGKGSEWEKKK